jgi:multicomponent Na+:H+ antiporter subunit D
MIEPVPPAAILILGALLIPFFKGRLKKGYLLVLPVVAFVCLAAMPDGRYWTIRFIGFELIFGRVDRLSLAFGYVFVLITFIGNLYALHIRGSGQHIAGLIYAGAALGITFSGDLLSLFFFWEVLAVASVFLILSRRTGPAAAAGFRYFMWHFAGGVCLLAGIILYISQRGTAEFAYIGLENWSSWLIFIGFCLNAAVFPLHTWLPDAYPQATVTGAVFMSAMTTKSAVYILARTFPGTELLIWAGAFMTCFPIFYAVIVNDIRRVLAYSLINQVGFMVCGIGIGTPLALNGVVAHAFCHIIYKALLFMSAGAVLHMTGKIRATDLGGLHKTMPFTALCCMIGAASISAFPLFSGFVSKSMTVTAAAEEHLTAVWLMLMFASAGVFHHAGIKVPYFVFFSHDAGIRTQEPPLNMRWAMGMAAGICIFLGIYPAPLYRILPYPVDYVPYTAFHVVGMLQLLMFGALAFTMLVLSGYYPPELRAVNLDTDWFARLLGRRFVWFCQEPLKRIGNAADRWVQLAVKLSKTLPFETTHVEKGTDAFFHSGLTSIPHWLFVWGKSLKTETQQLSWNLLYILMPFVAMLVIALFWIGHR